MEIGTVIGWLGNAALFVGCYLVGCKHRHAFGFYVLGDALWFWESCIIGRLDWAAPCVIFGLMALWNWRKWCRDAYTQVSETGSHAAQECEQAGL